MPSRFKIAATVDARHDDRGSSAPLVSACSPRGIVGRHPDHQTPNLVLNWGSAPLPGGLVPLAGHKLAMPSEDGVGRDDARHLLEQPTSEPPAEHALRRRRSLSLKRRRRPCSWARSPRFSSRRNAMTSRCSRSSHPNSAARSKWNGTTREVYASSRARAVFRTLRWHRDQPPSWRRTASRMERSTRQPSKTARCTQMRVGVPEATSDGASRDEFGGAAGSCRVSVPRRALPTHLRPLPVRWQSRRRFHLAA
jgi:hypothetical protein